jgi:hypothetical protein
MSAQPKCPFCGAPLFPHEVSNDECGTCGRRLSLVESGTAPRPADDFFLLPSRPPPEAFATVRQGINLVRWGVIGVLMFGVFLLFAQFAASVEAGAPEARFFQDLLTILRVLDFVAALLVLLGVCFCCVVPRGCEAARWARLMIGTLLVGGALTLAVSADFVFHIVAPGLVVPIGLDATAAIAFLFLLGVVPFGCLCCFLLFTALARMFGDRRLARGLGPHFVSTLCVLFLGFVGGCVVLGVTSDYRSAWMSLILLAVASSVGLASVVGMTGWLVVLLTRRHRLIPTPDDPNRRDENPFRRRTD